MIPIKLTIEGLYSYQERQVICFDQLIDAGLFGIFGRVGSGKSSILEAISFALYGETERLNSKDNRAYNMMNLKANRSVIDFEFYNFEDKKYRVFREFKRNSKRFEDVKRTEAVLYAWESENWVPLEHLDMTSIIGLSYENFKRTIIIPQGKFKEFIELGGSARTKMMQEIFGLDRFDLSDKVRRLYLENKEQQDRLSGQLQGVEELTVAQIEQTKEALHQAKESFVVHSKSLGEELETYTRLKTIRSDFELLQQQQQQFSVLEQQYASIQEEERQLIQFERIEKAFKQPLFEEATIKKQQVEKKAELDKETTQLELLELEFEQIQNELKALEPEITTLDDKKKKLTDLDIIASIKFAQEEIAALKERSNKGIHIVKDQEIKLEQAKQILTQYLAGVKDLKARRIDTQVLVAVGNWFANKNRIEQQTVEEQAKVVAVVDKIGKISQEMEQLGWGTSEWQKALLTQETRIKEQLLTLQSSKSKLELKQQLSQYAASLHAGESCPLCGALEHPHVAVLEDVSADLESLDKQVLELEMHREMLRKKEQDMLALVARKQLFEQQFKELSARVSGFLQSINEHLVSFSWQGFHPEDEVGFQKQSAEAAALEQKIEQAEHQVEQQRLQVEDGHKKVELYRQELAKIERQELEVQTKIKTNELQLRILSLSDFLDLTRSEVVAKQKEEASFVDAIETQFKKLTTRQLEVSPNLASRKTIVARLELDIHSLKQQNTILQERLTNLLQENQMTTIESVGEILNQAIEVSLTRTKIQDFYIAFATLKNGIATLVDKLGTTVFDEVVFTAQQEKVTGLEQLVQKDTETVATLQADVTRLEIAYEKKKALLLEQERLQKRAINIQLMSNLFKGSGFVNYVSAIYLRNLCEMANARFHRLTKNQLSLQLNESNEFEIIDYLNNGKPRSVKTLSGGQSFQVSLSLALALAESVQSLSKSNKNFFFIDEGFGTQDSESVNTVFETLNDLHKENRIVGIISHVEELQERIPVSVTIVKDIERGSLLETSF